MKPKHPGANATPEQMANYQQAQDSYSKARRQVSRQRGKVIEEMTNPGGYGESGVPGNIRGARQQLGTYERHATGRDPLAYRQSVTPMDSRKFDIRYGLSEKSKQMVDKLKAEREAAAAAAQQPAAAAPAAVAAEVPAVQTAAEHQAARAAAGAPPPAHGIPMPESAVLHTPGAAVVPPAQKIEQEIAQHGHVAAPARAVAGEVAPAASAARKFKGMSNLGKAGLIGGGLAAAGLGAYGLHRLMSRDSQNR